MSTPYIGEIRMFAGNFAPAGWALCDGQLLSIAEHDALFTLIGTTYGGDGQSTFALPDLRGRAPLHTSGEHPLGELGGSELVTLTAQQLPEHTHVVPASTEPATAGTVSGTVIATMTGKRKLYAVASGSASTNMSASAVSTVGSGAPHENRMPYLAVGFIIALFGIFPSQG